MHAIALIQEALREFQLDGWLLYDFRGSNPLARRVLGLDDRPSGTRRWFYFVPARGTPTKVVHRIESAALDHLPGATTVYLTWRELAEAVANAVGGTERVAMEYSPRAANPYVSRVDAGTIELVTSCGTRVESSGDLIQQFEATWSDRQWELHQQAAVHTNAAFEIAWRQIADHVRTGRQLCEIDVQAEILRYFQSHQLVTSHPPIVAVGPHSGDPHYCPGETENAIVRRGDFVLIDLWAKVDDHDGVYSDLTRVAFVDQRVPDEVASRFEIVARARDAAIDLVRSAFASRRILHGWEVDQAARRVIESAGFGAAFIHRTGHSIGAETHGNGANMDNLETRDERRVLPRTCFSIEPGIYLPDFGVRSETNLFVDATGQVHVTGGPPQMEVLPILIHY